MNAAPREKLTPSESLLREFALAYPETKEDFPWGYRALKVKKKAFVFMGAEEGMTSMSFKLPKSAKTALKHSFTEPTHYGLGKHGWVTATFDSGDDLPMDLLRRWIDESYRAVAPKTLVKQLEGAPAAKPAPTRKKKVTKK
jgi:predicted DNA-binding protein (MmcQ/YjbR family)